MVFVTIFLYFLIFLLSSQATKDIVFVLDRSGSLDSTDVTDAIEFIHNVTEWLTIGTDDVQVSLVTYSDNVWEEFHLGKYTNKTELLSAIDGLRNISSGGGTYTYDALDYVRKSSYNISSGGRPNADKAVVVITDGASNDLVRTIDAAESLRSEHGAEIYSIGIGSQPDEDELNGISNDPDSYFTLSVEDFIYLCNLIPAIVPKLDSEVNATLSESCPAFPTQAFSTLSTPITTIEQISIEQSSTTTETSTTTEESTTTTTLMTITTELSTSASTTEQTTTESLTTTSTITTTVEPTTTTAMSTTTEESTTTTALMTTTTESSRSDFTTESLTTTSTLVTTDVSTTVTAPGTTTLTETTTTSIEDTTETTNLKSERITENNTSNNGLIIGIAIGLLALLGFLILLFCIRKKIKSQKPGPIVKKDFISKHYSEASLRQADIPRPLSYRKTTHQSQHDTNGLLRESTSLSTFDVYV